MALGVGVGMGGGQGTYPGAPAASSFNKPGKIHGLERWGGSPLLMAQRSPAGQAPRLLPQGSHRPLGIWLDKPISC